MAIDYINAEQYSVRQRGTWGIIWAIIHNPESYFRGWTLFRAYTYINSGFVLEQWIGMVRWTVTSLQRQWEEIAAELITIWGYLYRWCESSNGGKDHLEFGWTEASDKGHSLTRITWIVTLFYGWSYYVGIILWIISWVEMMKRI